MGYAHWCMHIAQKLHPLSVIDIDDNAPAWLVVDSGRPTVIKTVYANTEEDACLIHQFLHQDRTGPFDAFQYTKTPLPARFEPW